MTAEEKRLTENDGRSERWHLWGPYLSERQWGTVREDYSANGDAWNYFPHEHARSRTYRWGEDGIGGISDFKQRLCFAFAFWNGRDPFLKERLFGLTGPQGNHGEDVKEVYFYEDNTPSHSYMRMTYRYPQAAYPYDELVRQNAQRSKLEAEYELWDTGVLNENRFFDVTIEYAKADTDDILIRATVTNHGPEKETLHCLPTFWFRNTWSWGRDGRRPNLRAGHAQVREWSVIEASHHALGEYQLLCEGVPDLLFTENDSNLQLLYGAPNGAPFVKDAFHERVVRGNSAAVNPERTGTKAAAQYAVGLEGGASHSIRLRLQRLPLGSARASRAVSGAPAGNSPPPEVRGEAPLTAREARALPGDFASTSLSDFDAIVSQRQTEADEFYHELTPQCLSPEHCAIQRQALAGLLWTKQFYYYVVEDWLNGDPAPPPPPNERKTGRNSEWTNLYNERVMSMPDSWEYPWYAAWDLAFHCISLALVDPHFAKGQLDVIVREWYQHPNGQMPAYEWNFGDVNPPVIGWAAWRIYKIEQRKTGKGDRAFLETIFHKLLINFTWWVNRKDSGGRNIFEGGFLGLDNIGVFDRNANFADGTRLEQSDGTSWMGMYCLTMMRTALELARENPVYENIATKFFEHFLGIAGAMNNVGGKGIGLWDEPDEFFYDVLHLPGDRYLPLRVRSLVGLMPLLAVETIEPELLEAMPGFKERLEWYLTNRPDLAGLISRWQEPGAGERRLIALTRGHRMKCLLRRMLDPNEFLSDYGIRSVSKFHEQHPYVLEIEGEKKVVNYEPGESQTNIFGGNSNWRGPVWFPINYLLIESLQKFHHYYGDEFKVECPTGSGQFVTLDGVANELSNRLIKIWLRDEKGERPFTRRLGDSLGSEADRARYLFHEYFHGDSGAGLGASHQTGWTALVAKLIQQQGSRGTILKLDPFTDL
ncbi:MAG: glucosidase [Chthoniobacterales bacterium]|nr:glucosidase [Chthoniobacterales bacterium]